MGFERGDRRDAPRVGTVPPGSAFPGAAFVVLAVLAAGCASAPAHPPALPLPPRDASRAAPPDDGRVERLRGPVARLEEPAPREVPPPGAADAPAPARKGWFAFPPGPLLYDPYLAAQRQSRTAVKVIRPFGGGDHERIEATIGVDRSLVRWKADEDSTAASEVEFEAAVFTRFDVHTQYEMEASDWRFGLPFVHRDGNLAWKIHLYHLSSHLGDDYIKRTGRTGSQYHLEEVAGGLSWDATADSRIYGEAGAAVYNGPATYSGRVQAGYEWVGRKWGSGLAPYFAVDLQARKEQDWTPDATVAVGIAFGRNFRLGLEYYHGRDTQTQFLARRTHWVSVGLYFDY